MALAASAWTVSAASAQQQRLLPTPYPEQLGPNAVIGGGAQGPHRRQELIPDPVPQTLGPNALGNPRPFRRHKHQRLLRTPYWRQYHHWR
jgi:hypothetical protein